MCFLESIFISIVVVVIVNYAVEKICDKLLRDGRECRCYCAGCCCGKCERTEAASHSEACVPQKKDGNAESANEK